MSSAELFALELQFSPLSTGERNVGRLVKLAITRGFEWCVSNRSEELGAAPHWWVVAESIALSFDWSKFEPLEVVDVDGVPTIRHGCRRALGLGVAMGRGLGCYVPSVLTDQTRTRPYLDLVAEAM